MIQMTYLWRYEDVLERLGERAVDFFFQIVFCLGWRSVLALTFKKKHDVQTCSNYRGMISFFMKPWERVVKLC